MQNEAFEGCDEVEPRRMPEQASNFDTRPIPVVPELSLILEKSQQTKRMDDTAVNNMTEIRSSVPRDATFRGGESTYAAWKEKQFPQHSIRTTPNRLHEIYSSTQIANSSQSSPTFNQSYSRDPKYINQNAGLDTPRKFNMARGDGPLQNPNKYVLSHHARVDNESHHHLNGSPGHNHLTRSQSTEGRLSSDRRRFDQDTYESRFHNRDEIRSPYDRKTSDYGRGSNATDKRSEQDDHTSRFHTRDGMMSPRNLKRSDSDRHVSRHYNKDQKFSPSHIRRAEHSQGLDCIDRRSEHSHGVEFTDRRRSDHSNSSETSNQRRSDHLHSSESSKNESSGRRSSDHLHQNESSGRRSSDHSHQNESSSRRNSDHSSPHESNSRRNSDHSSPHESNSRRNSDHSSPHESSGRRSSDHLRAVEPYDMRSKTRIQRSSSCSKADSYMHRNTSLDQDYHSQHSRSLQPVHCSPEHTHSHSYSHHHHTSCCSNHSNSNTETETVKNLLNVITSQNEQIKNLQKQVERLLKLHEDTLKEKHHCTCQPNGRVYQNPHHYEQSRNPNLPIAHGNGLTENERYNMEKCFPDLNVQDEKNQQAILEQKVSIGVMTSFELKLQNNPNLGGDNELKHRNGHEKVLPGSSNMMKNLVNDTGEMIRKKSNFFNPNALENISEASESHMSSLRQSHLCSDTTRQSIEAQDSVDVQSANQYKHRYEESQNRAHETSKKASRNEINSSNGKNSKRKTNGNYKANDQRFEENDNYAENVSPFVYNFDYENVCSSPQNDYIEKRTDEFHAEPLRTDNVTKMKSKKCDNYPDENLSLSSSDLDVEDFNPQSPEPSIHLDMQEYSSEGGSLPPQRAGKVGWTIYNNVLDQVNKILQNTRDDSEDEDEQPPPNGVRRNDKKEYDNNIMDTVKAATLEQLTKLGISFSDTEQREPSYNKKVVFDQASYYTRQGPEGHIAAASGGSIETNTSMHMKALAMKYLNEEQLADMQKPRASALKQVPSNGQNTNMSFATMHYLQRYHLLPGNGAPGAMREAQIMREDYRGPAPMMNERPGIRNAERREPSPHRYMPFSGTSKVSYPSKILDISTLKQQPKLL